MSVTGFPPRSVLYENVQVDYDERHDWSKPALYIHTVA